MKRHLISRLRRCLLDDTGSATAEYAIATLAAVGFAGLLVVILRSDAVRAMLTNLIQHALSTPS
jgi:Flp pilus assembly pilin Flp